MNALLTRARPLTRRVAFAAEALTHRQASCPFCRSRRRERVATKAFVLRILRCADCGLHFTSPIHAAGRLARFYDAEYAAEGSTTALPDAETLATLLARDFRGTDKDFHERLAAIAGRTEGRDLIELGCSWGYLLHQARAHGFDALGVEIGEGRRRYGVERLGVRAVAELVEVPPESRDLAVSFHVLEHLSEPGEVLSALHSRLRPGGEFWFEVPHFAFRERGRAVLPIIGAVHPLGLDEPFLDAALPRVGFEVLAKGRSWAMLLGEDPTRDDEVLVYRTRAVRPH